MISKIGILGAGKLGLVLARLAVKAELQVRIAGSGEPDKIAMAMDVLAPGAIALQSSDVIRQSEIIILALPLGKFKSLSADSFEGKLIIDAMNYWWEVDGIKEEFDNNRVSTSEMVRDHLQSDRLFKAFSHTGYHDLLDSSADPTNPLRKAIAFAGDNKSDISTIEWLIDTLGYDPVYIGSLNKGIMLQPGSNIFGANVNKNELIKLLDEFSESKLGKRMQFNLKTVK